MKMQMDTSSLHYAIVRHSLDRQHAPSIAELAEQFRQPRDAVVAALRALQDWKQWSSEEARAIFERFGLAGPTWDIPTSTARF